MLCHSHAMKYYTAITKNEINQIDQYKKYGTILSEKSKFTGQCVYLILCIPKICVCMYKHAYSIMYMNTY